MIPKISNHKTDIATTGEGAWPMYRMLKGGINREDFKRDFNLTISKFAEEISSFNHWSFPKEIQILGRKLQIAFLEWKIANKGESPEKIKNLKQKQYDLFVKISEKIKKWYDEVMPKNTKYDWGEKAASFTITKACLSGINSNVEFLTNKFYFISQQAFDYLLPE